MKPQTPVLPMALITACGMAVLFAQQPPAGPYTADQVAAGRVTYQTNCSSCQANDLSGREGPQLAGSNFLAQWGDRTAGQLISLTQSTMPAGGAMLPGETHVNLVAFILDANSPRPGNQGLNPGLNRDDSQHRYGSARSVPAAQRHSDVAANCTGSRFQRQEAGAAEARRRPAASR
jgi:mono/diheme cytochrome c family protein